MKNPNRVYSYDEFFADPITPGRFWWNDEGVSLLIQIGKRRGEHMLIYTNHEPGNWARPGPVNGWDGDLENPTLQPSILAMPENWHGFLVNGQLQQI